MSLTADPTRIPYELRPELEREGEGALWTVLGEFADLKHNAIPQPDRAVDNSTIWAPDFNQA